MTVKKPSQENEHLNNGEQEGEILDFTKPDFTFIPKGNHEWRQEGPYLVCYSCQLKHAVYIGMNKMMVGIDKTGMPILKNREFK